LTFGALIELWADAGALLKAEVAGLQALNSLLAFASAGEWVPVQRWDAFQLRFFRKPARIPGDSYVGKISYDNVVDGNNAFITACAVLNVQDFGVITSSVALSGKLATTITAVGIQHRIFIVTNDRSAIRVDAKRSSYA
jgi:hypothetical protein